MITARVQRAVGAHAQMVPLHAPEFTGRERELVLDCLDSTFVSSVGEYVNRFERDMESYTGIAHAVAVVNGTAALHLALTLAGVQPGDEVLLPALSFVATANAVMYCHAVPHFVDSEASTLGLDPDALSLYLEQIADRNTQGQCLNRRTGRRIAAIVPMHTLGHPVRMAPLAEVAACYGLPIVEDAAESLGSWIGTRHTGSTGLVAALSFNGNKIITTGGGGMVLTTDAAIAQRAKHLSTTARIQHQFEFLHDATGYNYRLPNLNAALGVAQLERLPSMVTAKRALAAQYAAAFTDCAEATFIAEPAGTHSNYWLNAVRLADHLAPQRDSVLQQLNAAGLQSRPLWKLLSELPMYSTCPSMDIPVARQLVRTVLCLPSSANLARLP